MNKIKSLIIGSGPTGLGAGYRLKESGEHDFLLLERGPHVGGLAASFVDEKGFTWDIGGHVQFSHYPYFDRVMKEAIPEEEWLHHQRESWVWMYDRFVPYPFQNNIRYLPRDAMWNCLKGLLDLRNKEAARPINFREWIQASFGTGIAEEFMLPYNYKVWAYPAEELAYQWIGERVATVDLSRILENYVYEKMDASWGPNNTFQFPRAGGTGAIWDNVARLVGSESIKLNSEVESISPAKKLVTLKGGEQFGYDHLLSTMPLDRCSALVEGLPAALVSRAAQLKHSTSNIVGIGVKGALRNDLATKCWMYFPEESTPFYRVTVFSNYSPNNVPGAEYFSLMCEVSESSAKAVSRDNVIRETAEGLKRIGFLGDEHEIVSQWKYSAEYGYPTPSLERDDILSDVVPQLDALGVFSRGRFGGWKYEVSNQDHSFMQGVEWANRMLSGEREITYRADSREDPNMSRTS